MECASRFFDKRVDVYANFQTNVNISERSIYDDLDGEIVFSYGNNLTVAKTEIFKNEKPSGYLKFSKGFDRAESGSVWQMSRNCYVSEPNGYIDARLNIKYGGKSFTSIVKHSWSTSYLSRGYNGYDFINW
jgi:hypothetical protein